VARKKPCNRPNAYDPNQEEAISERKMINKIHEKEYKNKPMTEEQKSNNTIKSKDTHSRCARFWLYGTKHEMHILNNHIHMNYSNKKQVDSF